VTPAREQLLYNEIVLTFVRAAVDAVDPNVLNEKSAAESGQDQRRRNGTNRGEHTPIRAPQAT
jgi:hypothetical protein